MDDSTKTLIKVAGAAAGLYLVYEFLHSSGLWAQWFGGNTFTDPNLLFSYCAANPAGTAVYTDSTGKATTVQCSAVNAGRATHPSTGPAPASGAPSGASAVQTPSDYAEAIQMMQAAAGGPAPQSLDGWAYYWQNGHPFATAPLGFGVPGWITPTMMAAIVALAGGDRNKLITADQFVAWLNQSGSAAHPTGVAGISPMGGLGWNGAYEESPYAWSS